MSNQNLSLVPCLNQHAPEFEAKTTHGIIKLSDYRGRWVVFFSFPGAFTPVCTTEMISFTRQYGEFKAMNCELLGISLDSKYSQLAWMRNIEEKFDIRIPFPMAEDPFMQIANMYGMLQSGTSDAPLARSIFVIDGKGILRAMMHYPITNGRSVAEILRVLGALQVSEDYGVSTPENWYPGDAVTLLAPTTTEELNLRIKEQHNCLDWYFCKKEIRNHIFKKSA